MKMLKMLRIATFVFMVFTFFLMAQLIVLGVKDNSEAAAFFRTRNLFEKTGNNAGLTNDPKDTIPELVVQARAFALRIDPPKIEKEIPIRSNQKKTEDQGGKGSDPDITIITPKPPPPRFDLLATVRYVSVPEKSLALFQTGGREEWFYKGQTVGRYEIEDIKDGRVLLLRPGQQSQEVSVPPKCNKTLLKGS
jgi:hypothetical protein